MPDTGQASFSILEWLKGAAETVGKILEFFSQDDWKQQVEDFFSEVEHARLKAAAENNLRLKGTLRFGDIVRRSLIGHEGKFGVYHYGALVGEVQDKVVVVLETVPRPDNPREALTKLTTFEGFAAGQTVEVLERLPESTRGEDKQFIAKRMDLLRRVRLPYDSAGRRGINCEHAAYFAVLGTLRSRQVEAECKTHELQARAAASFDKGDYVSGAWSAFLAWGEFLKHVNEPLTEREKARVIGTA